MKRTNFYFIVILLLFIMNILLIIKRDRQHKSLSGQNSVVHDTETKCLTPASVALMLSMGAKLTGVNIDYVDVVNIHGRSLRGDMNSVAGISIGVYVSRYTCSPCVSGLIDELFSHFEPLLGGGVLIVSPEINIREIILIAQRHGISEGVVFMEGSIEDPFFVIDKPVLIKLSGNIVERAIVYDESMRVFLPSLINALKN